MRKAKRISPKELVFSFKVAIRGIWFMLRSQRHAWIHLTATLAVCITGAYFGVTRIEWCWLVMAMTSVWTAETLNTALELLCDVASPEFHPLVENAKDVAAGAVLICIVGAVIIGLIIFIPYY
ncbi:MAG: diacylglycerol kinase family protein [Candidatus Omnitrophica bacterium]|nr:diacylglycerol kinase family protein [Candidatus Omnitrophota bacterium]